MTILAAIVFLGSVFFLAGMNVFLRDKPKTEENIRYENLGYLFVVFLSITALIIYIYSGPI